MGREILDSSNPTMQHPTVLSMILHLPSWINEGFPSPPCSHLLRPQRVRILCRLCSTVASFFWPRLTFKWIPEWANKGEHAEYRDLCLKHPKLEFPSMIGGFQACRCQAVFFGSRRCFLLTDGESWSIALTWRVVLSYHGSDDLQCFVLVVQLKQMNIVVLRQVTHESVWQCVWCELWKYEMASATMHPCSLKDGCPIIKY